MVRKEKTDGADEEDMATVVAVHNNMNENTWRQVLCWEALHPVDATSDKAPKLLRFLGERTFERVGSNKTLTADVRLIAATNKNL